MSLGLMNQNMVFDKKLEKENGDTNCQTTPLNRPGTLTNKSTQNPNLDSINVQNI